MEHKPSGEGLHGGPTWTTVLCESSDKMLSITVCGGQNSDGQNASPSKLSGETSTKSDGGDFCGERPEVYITGVQLEAVLVPSHRGERLAHRNSSRGKEVFWFIVSEFSPSGGFR